MFRLQKNNSAELEICAWVIELKKKINSPTMVLRMTEIGIIFAKLQIESVSMFFIYVLFYFYFRKVRFNVQKESGMCTSKEHKGYNSIQLNSAYIATTDL